ncbi:MAG: hypothetical protein KY463_04735, partial [Actinobacteria bacterium]|nr:hypothetical protein [Actinomycetota bacterium]
GSVTALGLLAFVVTLLFAPGLASAAATARGVQEAVVAASPEPIDDDAAILVRWQLVLPPVAPNARSSHDEQIEHVLAPHLPAFALRDDRDRAYRSLRRSLSSIAAIADSGNTTARGTQLFSPAAPEDLRVLRLEANGRQFVIDIASR